MQEETFSPNSSSFNDPDNQPVPPEQSQDTGGITWTASEYIAHHKTAKWYIKLGIAALILAAIIWLLTKDEITAGVVIVGAIVLGAYGSRPPRELRYYLDESVLVIDQKQFNLHEFKSFSVDDQLSFSSVNLIPLKRFAPGLSIYYAPEDEEAIISTLAKTLPIEDHISDPIDRLMHMIRF